MLLSPLQGNYHLNNKNNNDSTSMDLSPHHQNHLQGQHHLHNLNSNNLGYQLTEQLLTSSPKCYSPRPGQRGKAPPHITICPPDSVDGVMTSRYLDDDELDNEVFHSPTNGSSSSSSHSTSSFSSDEKHEVHSGRLYLIRHTGSGSGTASPTSPSRSPSRGTCRSPSSTVQAFSFRSSSPSPPSQAWSAPNFSPPSPSSNRKMSVFVRVYRCNMDHFAVISRDALYTTKPVYVNMRHCRVIPGDCLGRFIVAGKCDSGNVIEFEAPDLSSLELWLDAFQTYTPPASPSRSMGGSGGGGSSATASNTPPIPRSPALPTLAETDEED